jgi:hypothetical protein
MLTLFLAGGGKDNNEEEKDEVEVKGLTSHY